MGPVGGSLNEVARIVSEIPVTTVADHAADADESPVASNVSPLTVETRNTVCRTMVKVRAGVEGGLTLATAPVVVGGGRGVGRAAPRRFKVLKNWRRRLGGVVE